MGYLITCAFRKESKAEYVQRSQLSGNMIQGQNEILLQTPNLANVPSVFADFRFFVLCHQSAMLAYLFGSYALATSHRRAYLDQQQKLKMFCYCCLSLVSRYRQATCQWSVKILNFYHRPCKDRTFFPKFVAFYVLI